MKKNILFLSIFLASFIDSDLKASTVENIHIDRFEFDVRTDYIVGALWNHRDVLKEHIEAALHSVSCSSRHSSVSSSSADGGWQSLIASSSESEQIEEYIRDFLEVTQDTCKERAEQKVRISYSETEQVEKLQRFADQIRARGEKNTPDAVKHVLYTVAEKY